VGGERIGEGRRAGGGEAAGLGWTGGDREKEELEKEPEEELWGE